ncbi:cytochrome-c peroxidase [Vibrio astriarenae]|uniref:cytochrome-c peroxidase n=1 Tax=Vibrio astriarenae TaxID=1481923 RepID=UPI003735A809
MTNRKLILGCSAVMIGAVGILVFEGFRSLEHDHSVVASHDDALDAHQHHHQEASSVVHDDHSTAPPVSAFVDPNSPIQPIFDLDNIDYAKAKIGWTLFKDPNLSSNNQVSCETCHNLQTNGAELIPVSVGVEGLGERNSLTVFNAVYNYRFFWDGRVNTLEEQLDGPVHNPVEMDSSWEEIKAYVNDSSAYREMFSTAGLDISVDNIVGSIVEFENALTTPNAPFDRYLMGDELAINNAAKRGWEAFQAEGCIACHQGANVGGGMVMQFGYFGQDKTGAERSNDLGRFSTTSKPEDRHLFRVASLRNVAETAPYFHDGKTQSLDDAIKIMGRSQLGRELDQETIVDIKSFLMTLTGDRPTILERLENE